MRHYETMFVLKPTLTPEETQARIEGFKELLKKYGAEICGADDMGAKPLAYEVKKNKRGYFYVMYFRAPSPAIIELERVFRITEDVLKFMTIKFETKKAVANWQYMTDKASGKPSARPGFKKPRAKKEAPKEAIKEEKAAEQKEGQSA